MDIGLIFDWILMLFLFGSTVHKLLGKERKAVEALGLHHSIGYVIGALQFVAIYFVFIGHYLPVSSPLFAFLISLLHGYHYVLKNILMLPLFSSSQPSFSSAECM